MSSYTKSTNFASKDSLSTGNPLKILKGTEIDTEFNNISTAIATKADLNSPTLIGTPVAPTASSGTNTTQLATTAFVTTEIASLTVSTTQIEDDAVTTAKILNANVTSAKLADSGVTAASYGTTTAVPTIAVNAKGQITSASNSTIPLLGVGQTWQNLVGSRALGTTYTNSTSKPIMVSVRCTQANSLVVTTLIVDSVEVAWNSANGAGANGLGVCTVVPAGSTYSAANGTLISWAELR